MSKQPTFEGDDVNAVIELSWSLSEGQLDKHLSILCSALAIAARQGDISMEAFIANAGQTFMEMADVETVTLDPNRRRN